MAECTHGRFVLGLGVAPQEWNVNWHGLHYRNPVKRMREYIQCIRGMWSATAEHPLNYEGEYFRIKNYARFIPPPYRHIPIHLGAVLPAMIRLAGSDADGMIINTLNTPKYITEIVHPNLKQGMRMAGRSADSFELSAIKCCAINRNAKEARDLGRHIVAFYATLPYFDAVFDPMGFTEQKNMIRAAMNTDRGGMLSAVTDEMVETLMLAGTVDDVHRQLKAFDGLFETTLLFCPFFGVEPSETRANHLAMIEAFAQ